MTALVIQVVHHLGYFLLVKFFQAWHQSHCLCVVARHQVPSEDKISLGQSRQLLHDFFAETNQISFISSLYLLPDVSHLVINFELVESIDVVNSLSTQLVPLLC